MGTVLGRGGGGWDRMRIRRWIWIWIRCGIFVSKCPRDILANKKLLLFYDIGYRYGYDILLSKCPRDILGNRKVLINSEGIFPS